MTFGVVVGVPKALKGSRYWQVAWKAYDKWANAMFEGDPNETISSRLGKTKVYDCKPVFKYKKIDLLVAWWLHQIDHNHVEESIDLSHGCNCKRGHKGK